MTGLSVYAVPFLTVQVINEPDRLALEPHHVMHLQLTNEHTDLIKEETISLSQDRLQMCALCLQLSQR